MSRSPFAMHAPTNRRLLAVIPAFNEEHAIAEVVESVDLHLGCPVLVVSDDSRDGTGIRARAAGASVLTLSQQLGAWGATQAGLRYAMLHGYRAVVALDGDGQHPPDMLRPLVEQLDRGADVVIGTFPQRLSPLKRLAWAWFRSLTGLAVEDLTSGMRVYGPRALAVLSSPEATLIDYQDVGVLLLLRKHGLTVHEVPVTMYPRQAGKSRVFASWLTVARYMAQTTVICIARLGTRRVRRLGGVPT
jgi:glycosyltransferase involved in cell wall biosynthesis